jgi:hypothetical protein
LPDVEETEVGGQPVRSEHVEIRFERRARHDFAQRSCARDGVLLPAELADDVVARLVARIAALGDFSDGL